MSINKKEGKATAGSEGEKRCQKHRAWGAGSLDDTGCQLHTAQPRMSPDRDTEKRAHRKEGRQTTKGSGLWEESAERAHVSREPRIMEDFCTVTAVAHLKPKTRGPHTSNWQEECLFSRSLLTCVWLKLLRDAYPGRSRD